MAVKKDIHFGQVVFLQPLHWDGRKARAIEKCCLCLKTAYLGANGYGPSSRAGAFEKPC